MGAIQVSAREGYALWADTWDATPSPIVALEHRALLPWIARLPARRAIDVGCGTGRWTARLGAMGVDLSAAMLARAAAKPVLRGRLAVADATALPFANAAADLVLCALTLGHIRDQAAAMREFSRALAPGGGLLLTDFHPGAAALGWRRTFRNDGRVYELENHAYTVDQLCSAAPGLKLAECAEATIGESERALFDAAGRPELFTASLPRASDTADTLDPRMIPGSLDLTGHVVMPGLINAHEHLEFNLFPQLGRGPYPNAGEWARDIYHPDRSPIREQLRVPKPVRLWWGALKNLLSGVTTVCHHNPYEREVFGGDFPVRVVRRFAWAHSLEFEPDLAARFRRAPANCPFLVHCAEGTDTAAHHEVQTLDRLGALDQRTAIIHGVGITSPALALMCRRRASLVWCPTSNLAMFGRTVSRAVLRSGIPMALATDSALSAPVDLLDELAVARNYLPPERLYEMVTTGAARILRLASAQTRGDWIAVRSEARTATQALLEGAVALVVIAGRIRLISPTLARQLPTRVRRGFQLLHLENRPPVLVNADVRQLRRAAEKHLGRDLRLAGKRILS